MTEAFFDTSGITTAQYLVSRDSDASSTFVKFESTTGSGGDDTPQPTRTTKSIRTAEEVDTDEPADSSNFAVYEEHSPARRLLCEDYNAQRRALHQHIIKRLQELEELEGQYEARMAQLHRKVEDTYLCLSNELVQQQVALKEDREKYDREKELMEEIRQFQLGKVKLNVGGQIFVTSLKTLRRDPNSLLARMFGEPFTIKPEPDGSYFIDRDNTCFRHVLNYLRDLRVPQSVRDNPKIMDELIQEAQYYQIKDLLKLRWTDLPRISQEELYDLYPLPRKGGTPSRDGGTAHEKEETRFELEGKNLSGLDFSGYRIDPRSTFAGSNLENSRFDQAGFVFDFEHQVDFSDAYLVGAQFPDPLPPGVQFKLDRAITNHIFQT